MAMPVRLTTMASAIALLGLCVPAYAQDQAPVEQDMTAGAGESDEDIVVTGSRLREESVQDVPIAVTVFSQEAVEALHAPDLQGLTSNAPGLVISNNPTGNQVPLISLRGFSVVSNDISIEPGISVYIDGIYQPTIKGALADLFDVERVEVLRGPQSTLLGRNSSAGAILIRRTRPTNELGGRVRVEYGTDDLFQAQALLNVPLVDGILSGKIYGMYRHLGDYARNEFPAGEDLGGGETAAFRAALRFTPSANVDWYLSADYIRTENSGAAGRNAAPASYRPCAVYNYCVTQAPGSQVLSQDFIGRGLYKDYNLVSDLSVDLGGARLTSLTGYRDLWMINSSDVDGTPTPVLHAFDQITDLEAFSQEFRLSSVEGGGLDLGGRLAWLIAGYFNDNTTYNPAPQSLQGGAPTIATQQSARRGYALFGHVDFDVTDALTLSLGARQSWDRVRHDFTLRAAGTTPPATLPNTQSRRDENFSFEAGAQYQLDPTKMVYLRYAQGYRGGGFIGFPSSLAQSVGGYGPETSESWEVGLRSEFLDRRLLLNFTAFLTNFNDLQRSETKPSPTGFIIITDNIATARTQGLEFEAIARPSDGFNIHAVASYLDADYLDYVSGGVDLSATAFSYAPSWSFSLTPTYEFTLGSGQGFFERVRLQGNWQYRSTYLAGAQDIPELVQPGYSLFDAQISLIGGSSTRYTLNAYVQNLTDKRYLVYGVPVAPLLFQKFDERGRRFGISFQLEF